MFQIHIFGIDTGEVALSEERTRKLFKEFPQDVQDSFWEEKPPKSFEEDDRLFNELDMVFRDGEYSGFWGAYADLVLNAALYANCASRWEKLDGILGVRAGLPEKKDQFLLSQEEVLTTLQRVLGPDTPPVTVDWYEVER